MTPEEVRSSFEKLMPLPNGVSWDGDHYVYDREVIGSARNATTWAEMLRGYRLAFQQSNWISVNDQLPPIGQEVLVYVPSKIERDRNPVTSLVRLIRHEAARDFYWDNNYGGSNIHLQESVTHWAPLPNGPEE